MARRVARELAFRMLFQSERGGSDLLEDWERFQQDLDSEDLDEDFEEIYGQGIDEATLQFSDSLIQAFAKFQDRVDASLEETIEGWSFVQMAQTDLNILRLALTELWYEDIPHAVTIEMAVRMAKKFGGEESGRFVNGVLAKFVRSDKFNE